MVGYQAGLMANGLGLECVMGPSVGADWPRRAAGRTVVASPPCDLGGPSAWMEFMVTSLLRKDGVDKCKDKHKILCRRTVNFIKKKLHRSHPDNTGSSTT